MTTAGDALTQAGMAAHVYVVNRRMTDDYFFNADGELLIVPQVGRSRRLHRDGRHRRRAGRDLRHPARHGLQGRAVRQDRRAAMSAKTTAPSSRCPTAGRSAPIAWPIRATSRRRSPASKTTSGHAGCSPNGAAASTSDELGHSPLDVVAWHGNYAPYKYDLATFSPVGAILFDHPDPSIFTVLTAPSGEAGTANIDFVIFPPRWLVAEHSFRPPWYHRNIMSEFMGLIHGRYDAKEEGFVPGGISLHNMMLPHGPDAAGFDKATSVELKPVKLDDTMAFMFETRFPQHLTRFAAELETLQPDYADCWSGLKKRFNGTPEGDWS